MNILNARIGLAVLYHAGAALACVFLAIFWERLSKMDAAVVSMILTTMLQQSKDASSFFFSHPNPSQPVDPASNGVTK